MIEIEIPGTGALTIEHVLCDYNGTLAVNGDLIEDIALRLQTLAAQVAVHVVTADTYGSVERALAGLPVQVHVLPSDHPQDRGKLDLLHELNPLHTAALGNGRNDRLMLRAAVLGIGVIDAEGACFETLEAADMVVRSASEALDLLIHPKRLVAGLRI
ncbi:Soluble P-type ATPase [Sulfurivirga caldicuralii]|uniref:Soluble P-type ATPase n=1 Tax=Sulfurivirga caldicuralii TaxID=364032 RepID=A0A1N6DFU1_9GAMM|nr:HAD family hydrolase [Sulfurivirga caldicuralii]SIN69669.1 Soluble P-type ATPase [Sulfurivirga caldicuralii]